MKSPGFVYLRNSSFSFHFRKIRSLVIECWLFSFNTLNISFYCFLAYMVSEVRILIWVTLCELSPFFSAYIYNFSFLCASRNWKIVCLSICFIVR